MEAFKEVELTEEEIQIALLSARQKKYAQQKTQAYAEKIKQELSFAHVPAQQWFEKIKTLPNFIIDEYNEEQIKQLCFYFANDERCEFDLNKGLIMHGPIGCGKSTLMRFFRNNSKKSFAVISARTLASIFQNEGEKGIARFSNLIKSSDKYQTFGQDYIGMCIDDMGTEDTEKKNFGNRLNVVTEILLNRYDRNHDEEMWASLHITTNLDVDQITEFYGERFTSRLREMCNQISFDIEAPDRRK